MAHAHGVVGALAGRRRGDWSGPARPPGHRARGQPRRRLLAGGRRRRGRHRPAPPRRPAALPEAVLLDHDPDRDARRSNRSCAAVNELHPPTRDRRAGVAVPRGRGPSRYFGGDERLGRTHRRRVHRRGPACRRRHRGGHRHRRRTVRRGRRRPRAPGRAHDRDRSGHRRLSSPRCRSPGCTTSARSTPSWSACSPASASPRLGALAELPRRRRLTGSGRRRARPPPGRRSTTSVRRGHRAAARAPCRADLRRTRRATRPARVRRQAARRRAHAELAAEGRGVHPPRRDGRDRARRAQRAGVVPGRGLSAPAMVERVRWQLDGWMAQAALSAGVVLLRLDADEVRHDDGDQLRLWGGPSAADERATRRRPARRDGRRGVGARAGMAGRAASRRPLRLGAGVDHRPHRRRRHRLAVAAPPRRPGRAVAGLPRRRRRSSSMPVAARRPMARRRRRRRVGWSSSGRGELSATAGDAGDRPAGRRGRSPAGPGRGPSTSAGGTHIATAASPASRSSPPRPPCRAHVLHLTMETATGRWSGRRAGSAGGAEGELGAWRSGW